MTSTFLDSYCDKQNRFSPDILARKIVVGLSRRLPSQDRKRFEKNGGAGQALHRATTARDLDLDREIAILRRDMIERIRKERNYDERSLFSRLAAWRRPSVQAEADSTLIKALFLRGNAIGGILVTTVPLSED